MLDRFMNVVTISILLMSIIVFGISIYKELSSVGYRYNISDPKPWERYNKKMVIEDIEYSAADLVSAINKAKEMGEEEDVKVLKKALDQSYKSDGTRRNRMNSIDWLPSLFYAAICMLLLLLPLTINYIRHGKPRIWNSNTRIK